VRFSASFFYSNISRIWVGGRTGLENFFLLEIVADIRLFIFLAHAESALKNLMGTPSVCFTSFAHTQRLLEMPLKFSNFLVYAEYVLK
jgi:hypothetical protein